MTPLFALGDPDARPGESSADHLARIRLDVANALTRWHSHDPIGLLIAADDIVGEAAATWAASHPKVQLVRALTWWGVLGDGAEAARDSVVRERHKPDRVLAGCPRAERVAREWGATVRAVGARREAA